MRLVLIIATLLAVGALAAAAQIVAATACDAALDAEGACDDPACAIGDPPEPPAGCSCGSADCGTCGEHGDPCRFASCPIHHAIAVDDPAEDTSAGDGSGGPDDDGLASDDDATDDGGEAPSDGGIAPGDGGEAPGDGSEATSGGDQVGDRARRRLSGDDA